MNIISSPYTRGLFGAERPADLVRDYPFATLITPDLAVTAIPLLFEHDGDERTIIGHMNRGNPHSALLKNGLEALGICMGPDAYISPRWYEERRTVPTWNYLMAVVRGTIETVDDEAGQLRVLERTIEVMEASRPDPWSLDEAPPGRIAELLPRTRSFRIHVRSIEGITKLSQNQPAGDRFRVIAALEAQPSKPDVARLMREKYGE